MNRKNLTAAVLAGLAGAAGIVGSAQAVNINPDGLGQVLIYPYYTVNGGNTTLLSVVNTSEYAKAVKVRFLEGKNSREVLDFNLYMSPYDVWTASLKKKEDGTPRLKTADNTCTVPYIYGNGGTQDFLVYGMNDEYLFDEDDLTTYGDISRATEGHFEMIEMGVLTDEDFGSATAITHLNGGMLPATTGTFPRSGGCEQLVDAWTDPNDLVDGDEGYWLRDAEGYGPSVDIDTPMGGLFGGAAIVNVQNGTMYSYDAKAIDGFFEGALEPDLHFKPGFTEPSLGSGDNYVGTVFVDGMLSQYDFFDGNGGRTVDAVSYVFMHDAVMNEYTTESVVAGATEWVMTFPTKHFYVYEPDSDSDLPVDPFTSTWDDQDLEACEVVRLATIWDRNEQIPGLPDDPTGNPIPPIVSPAPPEPPAEELDPIIPFELCYETSVIAFGEMGGGILDSDNLHTINNATELFTSEFGWARLDMFDYSHDADEDGILDCEEVDDVWVGDECLERESLGNLHGLPVTGFAVQEFANATLGDGADVLANYGGIFQHKYTRLVSDQ